MRRSAAAERAAVVRACRFVDRVLDDPAPLHCTRDFLDQVGAACCCHGDDLSAVDIAFWYGDLIGSGRLRIVRYTSDISSRLIVSRVARRLRQGSLRDHL
jgi:glycerol-3-phosphate cytidylyltransferase-like family protein